MIPKSLDATELLRVRLENDRRRTRSSDVEEKERLFDKSEDQTTRLTLCRRPAAGGELGSRRTRLSGVGSAQDSIAARSTYRIRGCATRDSWRTRQASALRKAGVAGRSTGRWSSPRSSSTGAGSMRSSAIRRSWAAQKITGNLGTTYRDYLVDDLAEGKGETPTCVPTSSCGQTRLSVRWRSFGLLATNTIAQGDYPRGRPGPVDCQRLRPSPGRSPSRKWPGTANLEVAHVWLQKGTWGWQFVLDEKPVSGISAFFDRPGCRHAARLIASLARTRESFMGIQRPMGMGFVMEPEEAEAFIRLIAATRTSYFPYLNGEDLNPDPTSQPSRWVINFFDWPLERTGTDDYEAVAADYPDCLDREEKVKPERALDQTEETPVRRWWQFAAISTGTYTTIAGIERVLVKALTSKHHALAFVANNRIVLINVDCVLHY